MLTAAHRRLLPLAVTMGEPAGISGEITCKAWLRRCGEGIAPFFVIDDPNRLATISSSQWIGGAVPIQVITAPYEAVAVFGQALPVLPELLAAESVPGHLEPANARAVISSIERAVTLTLKGCSSAVVTNPIHKGILYKTGFIYPGHTEFLAALAGPNIQPVMMLVCHSLRVVPVTIHVALRQAITMLTTSNIIKHGRITANALRSDFGIVRPRLAVAALNPHAGESGCMGNEETSVILPAITALKMEHLDVFGPVAADTLFHAQARAGYDAVLCMYHDQALIPLKTIDFSNGVNVTLGLPFVRTSPDHGTALDIAGKGWANESSLIRALHIAQEMATRRLATPL